MGACPDTQGITGGCAEPTVRRVGCQLAQGRSESSRAFPASSGLGVINVPCHSQHDDQDKQTLNSSTDFKSLSSHRNSLALNLPARHAQPQGIWTEKQGLYFYITLLSARGQEQEIVCHD